MLPALPDGSQACPRPHGMLPKQYKMNLLLVLVLLPMKFDIELERIRFHLIQQANYDAT